VVGADGMVVVVVGAGVEVGVGSVAVVVGVELVVTVGMPGMTGVPGKSESVKVVGWRPPPVEADGEDAGVVLFP
jgi:hypothetical protein